MIKTPKTSEAVVLPTPDSRRSVNVKTETGLTRRNRSHLRIRDPTTKMSHPSHPNEKALLIPSRKETIQVELPANNTPVVQPETSFSQEIEDPTPRSRSGRILKPVKKLDL